MNKMLLGISPDFLYLNNEQPKPVSDYHRPYFLAFCPKGKNIELTAKEAHEKADKVKHALLHLESELRPFRDGNEEVRNVFRQELDEGDIGYVGCLLTALSGTEDQFKRWRRFSTYKFKFFRKKPHVRCE